MRDIRPFEPWFFLLFGLFHLHRVWALMAGLGGMCLWALALFFRWFRKRRWWRWAYLLGGGYVLFDLFAIAAGLPFWHRLLEAMFDTDA